MMVQLWWAIPLGVTILAFCWAFFTELGNPSFFADVLRFGMVAVAIIVSLVAWIIGMICK